MGDGDLIQDPADPKRVEVAIETTPETVEVTPDPPVETVTETETVRETDGVTVTERPLSE